MHLTMEILAIALSSLCMLAALGFTIIPLLPGTVFVIPGIVLYGLFLNFHPFSKWFWIGQVVLMLVNFLSDNVAQVFGLKKMGGSKAGMIGGTIGMFVVPLLISPLGLFAVVLGPLIGAVAGAMIGEMLIQRQSKEVLRVGWGAALSFLAGTFFKLVLVTLQVVWFYIAIF